MVLQTFYNAKRSTIDAMANGTSITKTEDEAYNLIEEMSFNTTSGPAKKAKPSMLEVRLMLMLWLYLLLKQMPWLNDLFI